MKRHEFLSDAWIVEAKRIRDRHIADVGEAPPIKLNLVVTDVPWQDNPLQAHIDSSGGAVTSDHEHLDRPDATISTSYAIARSMLLGDDPSAPMKAFFSGDLRIQGDMAKVMALFATAPTDATQALDVAREVREMTATDPS